MHTTHARDGVPINYDVIGDGEPMVLVHPSMSSSKIWHDLGYIDVLASRYQLILIDARGHGASGKPVVASAYKLQQFVADVVAVLDAEEIGSAHLMGYSLGGRVAFGCGVYAPERFRSLIIGAGTYHTPPGAFDRVSYPGALETIERCGIDRFLEEWEHRAGSALPEMILEMFRQNDATAIAPYLQAIEQDPDLEPRLPEIELSALLFVGSEDPDRRPAVRRASELIPNAELLELPGETHITALMQTETVVSAINGFHARIDRPVISVGDLSLSGSGASRSTPVSRLLKPVRY
jgi:pimeloyl-ACP methyl ester carboxylesterase